MRRTTRWSQASFAAALLLAAGLIASTNQSAAAATAISNLSNAVNGSNSAQFLYNAGNNIETDIAASFVAGSAATLTDVTLSFGAASQTNQPLVVQLLADSSGQPGGVLATLTGNTTPSSGLFTYAAPPNVALSAGTKYWVAASVGSSGGPASGQYPWNFSNNAAFTGDPGWTMGGLAFRLGTNGAYGGWTTQTFPTQLFSVQTTVPEPASLALLALGSSLMLLRRRR
jgi:PEP-CTERM motif